MTIVNADAKSSKENHLDYDKPSWHGNTIRQRLLQKVKQIPNGCWEWLCIVTGKQIGRAHV